MPYTDTSLTAECSWIAYSTSAQPMFSPANHDVFGAVQNNQEAKFIQQAEISGVEPAVFQHFRCRFWLVPVAFHDGRPFDAYFANFVSRQSLSLFVNNSDLGQGGVGLPVLLGLD